MSYSDPHPPTLPIPRKPSHVITLRDRAQDWGEDQTHQMIAMDPGEGSRNGHALPCFGGVRVSQLGLSNSAQARQAQAQVGVSSRRTGLSANLLGARNREQDALKLPLPCAEAGVNEAASPAYP